MRLLFVCTGNLSRSPYAERRAIALLGSGVDVEVASAGTRAPVGEPVDELTARLLAEHGLDAADHRARRVTDGIVQEADLVLTMTGDQRREVLELAPAALRRTFTLGEAEALAGSVAPSELQGSTAGERLAELVPRLAAARGRLPRPHPGFPDVVDPIGRSYAVHREAAGAIDQALAVLVPLLRPAAGR